MSLDTSKLEHVRTRGGKTTARCPACAEAGHDQTRNHLFIRADGRFGCVVYPGDSSDAKAHRKRVFALCGCREIRPLSIRQSVLGRLGRVDESHSEGTPVRTGLLGRVGRLFQTYLGTEQAHERKEDRRVEKLNDRERGVPGVLSAPAVKPRRPLTEGEWTILVRAGAVNEAIIIEALRLFDARVVE
jgi:hypothetical protein